jgi:hypothetical protein
VLAGVLPKVRATVSGAKAESGPLAVEIVKDPVTESSTTARRTPSMKQVQKEVVVNDDNAGKPLEEFNGAGMKEVVIAYIVDGGITRTPEIAVVANFVPSKYFGTWQYVGAVW